MAVLTVGTYVVCSTNVPVGMRLHWSTDPCRVWIDEKDGQCCGREEQWGRRTKKNWTKTAHHTHGYTFALCWYTHCCVVRGWAFSGSKVSACGVWEIRQPTCSQQQRTL